VSRRALRARVFILTWTAYASYYMCRKQLSVVKGRLVSEHGLTLDALGAIDTGYLVAYAVGQFASGLLCDRVGARRLLGAGMLGAAAMTAIFGLGDGAAVFAVAFAVNGAFQSTGWPGTIKAMTPWFDPVERGRVMGVWSTCYQVGGLAATALATWLLVHFGWRSAFFVPAVWTAAVGVTVFKLLPDRGPEEPAAAAPERQRLDTVESGWRQSLANPLVWNLGASYFCLKLIRYSLLFWLPLYLSRQLGYSEGAAGYQSLSFELGGVVGAVSAGALSDRFTGRRGPVLVAMTLGLAGAFVLYGHLAALGPLSNFAGMALVGFMLFGPDALLSATAAQDLGGTGGAGTAAGVINGVGSLGAIAQGAITAWVAAHWGWPALFTVFVWLSVLCSAILTLYAFAERRR